jgi:hypothetical protein
MDLKIRDRPVDETGEWEVVNRPYASNAGKNAGVRVKKVGQADVTEIRIWGAPEQITMPTSVMPRRSPMFNCPACRHTVSSQV